MKVLFEFPKVVLKLMLEFDFKQDDYYERLIIMFNETIDPNEVLTLVNIPDSRVNVIRIVKRGKWLDVICDVDETTEIRVTDESNWSNAGLIGGGVIYVKKIIDFDYMVFDDKMYYPIESFPFFVEIDGEMDIRDKRRLSGENGEINFTIKAINY